MVNERMAARAVERAHLKRRLPAGLGTFLWGLALACVVLWWVGQKSQ